MIELRRATDADAKQLSELGRQTFIDTFAPHNRKEDMDHYLVETFSEDKQLKEIRDPKRSIWIAWKENQAIGFLQLLRSEPEPCVKGVKLIELLRLYVDSKWHGRGVAALLIEKGIETARGEGFQTLWLGVWERNFRAQKFYQKYGFSRVGEHVFRLGTDDQIDIILSRSI